MEKMRDGAKGRNGSGGRAERTLQRDPERTRASIRARVDAIAERAGINKRMLYHYFGDKEQLYLAVLEEAYVGIRTAEKSLNLSDLEPEQGIAELAMFTWGYFLEHPEFLSLLGTENLHRARWLRQSTRLKELHSSFIDKLSDLLQRGKAGGLFRPDVDPLNLYLTIAALGYFYLSNQYTLSTIFGRDLMDKSNLDVWQRHIVHVTLASIRR
jgi:AcrR family transcriptional regulator